VSAEPDLPHRQVGHAAIGLWTIGAAPALPSRPSASHRQHDSQPVARDGVYQALHAAGLECDFVGGVSISGATPNPWSILRGSRPAIRSYDNAPPREPRLRPVDFDLPNRRTTTRFACGAVNILHGNFAYFDSATARAHCRRWRPAYGAHDAHRHRLRLGWMEVSVSNTPPQSVPATAKGADAVGSGSIGSAPGADRWIRPSGTCAVTADCRAAAGP
jgi:hypothetical protein